MLSIFLIIIIIFLLFVIYQDNKSLNIIDIENNINPYNTRTYYLNSPYYYVNPYWYYYYWFPYYFGYYRRSGGYYNNGRRARRDKDSRRHEKIYRRSNTRPSKIKTYTSSSPQVPSKPLKKYRNNNSRYRNIKIRRAEFRPRNGTYSSASNTNVRR